ncbi:MAG: VOC family protein [Actinobacteria bacterium]|nr:VOC family protein [Actinomycetota bacterium]
MTIRIETTSFDAHEPYAMAQWWATALGWEVTDGGPADDEVSIAPTSDSPERGIMPELLFCRVPEGKTVKNRIHLDLRPDDQAAEVARFEALGATRVDVGQEGNPDVTWVVLADPEGNEFCILRTRPPS